MNKKIEIGLRLKEFAKKKFDGIAGLERALGKTPAYFQNYLNGRSYLGGEILAELVALGCDINWLLNGTPSAGIVKEQSGEYMNYASLLAENKMLQVQITDLKLMAFDLQMDNKNLKKELDEAIQHNTALFKELEELRKGMDKSLT